MERLTERYEDPLEKAFKKLDDYEDLDLENVILENLYSSPVKKPKRSWRR